MDTPFENKGVILSFIVFIATVAYIKAVNQLPTEASPKINSLQDSLEKPDTEPESTLIPTNTEPSNIAIRTFDNTKSDKHSTLVPTNRPTTMLKFASQSSIPLLDQTNQEGARTADFPKFVKEFVIPFLVMVAVIGAGYFLCCCTQVSERIINM